MNWAEIKAAIKDTTWRPDTPDTTVERYAKQALREIMELRDWHWLRKVQVSKAVSTPQLTAPPDLGVVESLAVLESEWRYPLDELALTQLRARWAQTETGEPREYAYHDGKLWLGPAPDQAYDFELIYRISDTPTVSTWSNHLTTAYPQILIDLASGKLMKSYYQDQEAASNHFQSYEYSLSQAESMDDRKSRDDRSGMVQPDSLYYGLAYRPGHWSR